RQNLIRAAGVFLLFLDNGRRNIRKSLVGFLLGALALACFGLLLSAHIVVMRAGAIIEEKLDAVDQLTVYTSPDASEPSLEKLASWLESQEAVKNAARKPFDDYFSTLCDALSVDRKPFGAVPEGISPGVILVSMNRGELSRKETAQLIQDIKSRQNVLDVFFRGDALLKLSETLATIGVFSLFLLVVVTLCVISALLVGNLSLFAASIDELSIMKLSGAAYEAMLGPYLAYSASQWGLALVIAASLWHVFLPMAWANGLPHIAAQLGAPFATQLGVSWSIFVALISVILSVGLMILVFRTRLRRVDVFGE
ncbi:hypothetical protein J7M28_05410, partial [bacterium]|nr:hypothetical protein [bacterium]